MIEYSHGSCVCRAFRHTRLAVEGDKHLHPITQELMSAGKRAGQETKEDKALLINTLTRQAVGLPAIFHAVGSIYLHPFTFSQISSKCLGVSKQNLAHNKINA